MAETCKIIILHIIRYLIPIIGIVVNCLAFTIQPDDSENYIEFINLLKSGPIFSIKINNSISESQKNILILERLDSKYDYEFMLLNNNKKYHPCGKDATYNYLFLPNNIECPINFFELSKIPFSFQDFEYKTIQINDNYYLHYSNKNIEGYLYNNISVFYINSLSLCSNSSLYGINTFLFSHMNFTHTILEILELKSFLNLKTVINFVNVLTLILFVIWIGSLIIAMKNKNIYIFTYFITVIGILLEVYHYYYISNNFYYVYFTKSYKNQYNMGLFIYFCLMFLLLHFGNCFPSSYHLMLIYLLDFRTLYNVTSDIQYSKSRIKEIEEEKPGILKEIKKKKNELEPLINKENDIEEKIEEIKKQIDNKESQNMKDLKQEIKKKEEEIYNKKMYLFKENIYTENK